MIKAGAASSAFVLVLSLGGAGVGRAADDCKIATKGNSPVAEACKAGGIPKAKAAMKQLGKEAKAKGMKTDCDGCHKNDADWTLSDNARKDFDKMLALVGKAPGDKGAGAPGAKATGGADKAAPAPGASKAGARKAGAKE